MNEIEALKAEAQQKIASANDKIALLNVKAEILGKTGTLTLLLKGLKDIPADKRPEYGKKVNEAREFLERAVADKLKSLAAAELKKRLESEKVDITEPGKLPLRGRLHPLNVVKKRVVDFFAAMGFKAIDSPEIETAHYNFDMLNMPEDHPARDLQDTFFITSDILLRTQTSAGQIRTMERIKPPIKMISPGRVFRADEIDATHTPCFHQIEGLVVDYGITMCDLKGILNKFARYFFDETTKTRFRPSYFPFTEPSVEVDASCPVCGGKGCRVCKGTGWIEILGAGMVNRRVLSNCGIDPDKFTGFAFGMGLDRITAILHGITDARVPFEGDIRFLRQFDGEVL